MGIIRGNVSTLSLADLIQTLIQNQKEGTLTVSSADARKSIFFDRDGLRLLSAAPKGIPAEEEIYELFLWKEARFEFVEGPPAPNLRTIKDRTQPLKTDINSLLIEAARRLDEINLLRMTITNGSSVFVLTQKGRQLLARAPHDPAIRVLLGRLDGIRSVSHIIAESDLPQFPLWKALFHLRNKGYIEPVDVQVERHPDEQAQVMRETHRIAKELSIQPHAVEAVNPNRRKVVLIIDPLPTFRKAVAQELEAAGYEALEAAEATEAQRILAGQPIDAVLMDLVIPGIDGFEMIESVRREEKTRFLPLIIVTAQSERSFVLRAVKSGATDYVVKPFQRRIVIDKLNKALLDK
ncbi:MAG: response regulator [Planctomycetes bacterium]|nr:response regulator [Planctomycetota bacterium]